MESKDSGKGGRTRHGCPVTRWWRRRRAACATIVQEWMIAFGDFFFSGFACLVFTIAQLWVVTILSMTCQSVSVRRIKRSFILSGIVWEASWFGRAFCSPFLLVFYTKRVREEVPTVLFNSIGMQRFYPVSVLGIEVRYIYVIVVISNKINICRIYFMD